MSFARIEEIATTAAPHLALEVMDATEIVYFLTTLYLCWSKKHREANEKVDQLANEAMAPLMALRSIADKARTVRQFDDELERMGFERYDPPTECK